MTARSAAAISSLVFACGLLVAGCTSFYEIPIETPIQPKMDVSGFQRVLVAGFIAGGSDDVDANLETVRLLRSQLRTKSALHVIEADALPLAEVANEETQKIASTEAGTPSAPGAAGLAPVGDGAPAPDAELKKADVKAPKIKSDKDLQKYDKIFADVAYWKKLGEEYQNPLIVTGTILFVPNQANGFVTHEQEVYDSLGRRRVIPVRTYQERKGFTLQPRFVFIDGRTGTVLYSEKFSESRLYAASQNTPALSSYFEMMDSILPSFLSTLSPQKIRGTRVLLK
ncbi:MAG TPA: hypothetical protein VFX12_03325 [Vicinamibacterales bacterium]|nr:hypothetical protein [Vicinamibacterales bacterium]